MGGMRRFRHPIRVFLSIFAALIAVDLALLLSQRQLEARFRATLAKVFRTEVTVREVSLSLLRGLHVRGLVVRKGTRVRTRVIAAATRPQDAPGESVAVTLVNISTSGAMLTARAPLGKKGDTLAIKFKLSLNDIESYLDIETVLRNVEAGAATEQGAAQWQHGVEFREVAQQDLLMLTAYIYQKLLDESASGQ